MTKYARYNTDGLVTGWLDTDTINYPDLDISTLAVVSDDLWNNRAFGSNYAIQDGEISLVVPPPPTREELLAKLKSSLAAMRYNHETAGVSFKASGASSPSIVATDRDSQGKLVSAFVLASSGHWVDGTAWKMSDGSFVALTTADAQMMALTVQAYVAGCFANESVLTTSLDNADDPSLIDLNQGWPVS